MCVLCRMIQKEMLTKKEIARAYVEVANTTPGHDREILKTIQENDPEGEVLEELLNLAYTDKDEQNTNTKI